jgi:SAM-dependent methyltransferase
MSDMTLPLWFLIAGILVIVVVGGYFFFGSFAFGAGYQPTPPKVVERMLELAAIRPEELVYDLGAGTGAIVFRAARQYRARVVAVELEPIRVAFLRLRRSLSSDRSRITILWTDLFQVDLQPAGVLFLFLWPSAMRRLKPRLESQLSPGARVISHWHPVPGWTAAVTDPATRVYLYRWPECRAAAPGA